MDQFNLGWSHEWDRLRQTHAAKTIARITSRHKIQYKAITSSGELLNCYLAGKLLHKSSVGADLPTVGDWCVLSSTFIDETNEPAAKIASVFPRLTKVSRMGVGTDAGEQVLAANVSNLFIVTSLNRDFNIKRIQRYLLLSEHGGTTPIIVLSKADLGTDEALAAEDQVRTAFPDVECISTSAITLVGMEQIRRHLLPGTTSVFVGSSGVGKSTLVNHLTESEVQKTSAVREDDQRGRHTTSGAGLFFAVTGGMIIDTAGLREVQVLADEEDLDRLMPAVSEFASECKFRNCTHKTEPDCAVLDAIAKGGLNGAEFDNYAKLEREIAFSKRKIDQSAANEERKRWKKITVQNRQRKKGES